MTALRLAAAFGIVFYCLVAVAAYALEAGRYGSVRVVEPRGQARGFVIFFSDRNGLNPTDDAAARALADAGALVVEVDTPAYLARLDKLHEKCHQLVGDAQWVSQGFQRQHKFPKYFTPVMAGVGEGGTLAEMVLAQAPAVTIAGVVALNPSAAIASQRPICTALPTKSSPAGFRYGPPKKLPGFWTVGITSSLPKADRQYLLELQHRRAPVEIRKITATLPDALRALIAPHLETARAKIPNIPARLSLAVLPVEHPSKVMAVVLSGDGGWRDLDKTIGEDLQRQGVPVVGWDSLRYFWSGRTPEQTADDLAAVLENFMAKWHADKVALIGYSFGADVLPFAYNRLPESLRSHVVLIALLGLAKSADFEISVYGWLGLPPGPAALPLAPQLAKIPPSLMQCFYGQDETDTACPGLAPRGVEVVRTPGAHHFGGDYDALSRRILAGLKRRIESHAHPDRVVTSEGGHRSEDPSQTGR
jgi:type IV secretory pathway VirJ component